MKTFKNSSSLYYIKRLRRLKNNELYLISRAYIPFEIIGENVNKKIFKDKNLLEVLINQFEVKINRSDQELFAVIFGEAWSEAGTYCQILMPALAVRFIASTLSSTLGATNNNRYGAIWKVIAFVTTLVVLALVAPIGDIKILLYAIMINDLLLYAFYFALILKAAKRPRSIV